MVRLSWRFEMITLELNLKGKNEKVEIKDEILFNALLSQNENLVKRLIRGAKGDYEIDEEYFDVVSEYVDVDESGVTLYGGYIARTGKDAFAVLYLEDAEVDDDYIVTLIEEYVRTSKDDIAKEIDINKIEVDKSLFLKVTK